MVTIKNLLSLLYISAATSLTITKRDYLTISNDVNYINSNIVAVDNAVIAYDGSLFKALVLDSSVGSLKKAIYQGTNHARTVPSNSIVLAEANVIDGYVLVLTDSVHKLLGDFIVKKEIFEKYGLSGRVAAEIAELRIGTDAFADELIRAVMEPERERARARKAMIDRAYDSATVDYQQ